MHNVSEQGMVFLMLNNEEFPIKPSTLETVDTGFYDFIFDNLDIYTVSNKGFNKVPVLWVTPERAFQVKSNKDTRDSVGKLVLPIITIERTSVSKDPSFKGPIQADMRGPKKDDPRWYRGGSFHVKREINQEMTSKYQSMYVSRHLKTKQPFYPGFDSTGICYDDYFVPIPTYVGIMYTITLRSEYQQQMNDMLTPFITMPGQVNHFVFMKDGHKYEAFVQQDFAQNNNLSNMGEEERKFETKIEVKVLAYLIGQGLNDSKPKIIKRQSIVKLVAVTEVELQQDEENEEEEQVIINNQCYTRKSITRTWINDIAAIQAKAASLGLNNLSDEEKNALNDWEPTEGKFRLNAKHAFALTLISIF